MFPLIQFRAYSLEFASNLGLFNCLIQISAAITPSGVTIGANENKLTGILCHNLTRQIFLTSAEI